MTGYVLQRLVALPIVLLGVSLVTFGLMSLAPGDPAVVMLRRQGFEPLPEAVQALRGRRAGGARRFRSGPVGRVRGPGGRSCR
jgi:ABC-type dipeptide/oligopeptide/nickel transport system permease component